MTSSLSEASQDARESLCRLAARYHAAGWLFGTSGNLSARYTNGDGADRVVITASGQDKGQLGPDDFVEVDLSGARIDAEGHRRPSAETSIHLAIYGQVPSANAVLHVHTVASTLLRPAQGTPGQIDFHGREMIKGWGLWRPDDRAPLPFFENHPEVPRIAEDIATWLSEPRSVPALVITDHGITAWGEDVNAAHRHVEITEFLCQLGLTEGSM